MVESEDVEVEEVPQEVKILLPYTYKLNGLRDVFKKRRQEKVCPQDKPP